MEPHYQIYFYPGLSFFENQFKALISAGGPRAEAIRACVQHPISFNDFIRVKRAEGE